MQIIQDLSEKVNALMAEREEHGSHQEVTMDVQAPGCYDTHRRTKAPIVEIENFPELLEAILDLKEDFFRISMKENFGKDTIYGCPKFIGINYQPPILSHVAPPNVNKTESTLSMSQLKGPFLQQQQPGYSYPAATGTNQQAAPTQYKSNTSHNKGGQSQGKMSQDFPQKSKNPGAQ
ncbi:hypothetical protein AYI68_g5908 [Smittium mucronatum]|uniref:Uncharacterized protein n=1 Tax=Smittium mucronatum TaxID=133383 RepID=A0A1R0GT33_9FUNG|nr:hypothetical protein AYI68_g5908 [Smittium mucronatum]